MKPTGNSHRASPRINSRGDIDAGLRDADVTITREYRTPVALHTALEPHGAVAEWIGGRLTIWESTQGIFMTRREVAKAFGLPLSSVARHQALHGRRIRREERRAALDVRRRRAREDRPAARCAAFSIARASRPTPAIARRRCNASRSPPSATARSPPSTLDATIALGIGGWLGGPGEDLSRAVRVRERAQQRDVRVHEHVADGVASARRGTSRARSASSARWMCSRASSSIDPLELRRRNYAERDQDKDREYSNKRLDECYARAPSDSGGRRARDAARERPGAIRRGVGMASLIVGRGRRSACVRDGAHQSRWNRSRC